MAFFLLDTDILTLYQHNHPVVVRHMGAIPEQLIGVSVVTYEEQLRGRLDVVRMVEQTLQLANAYERLAEMQAFYCALQVIGFDPAANTIYQTLRQRYKRHGKMDLRIAATALAINATLVTRNRRDFAVIEGLRIEDWTVA